MPRTHYCTHLDPLRRFDPTLTQSDLDTNDYIGTADEETVDARLEGVESQFERDTGTALREVRVGSQGDPATYEYLKAKRRFTFPATYTLDQRNVHPIDSAKGDAIEVRTARDSWDDITSDAGSRWVLVDNRQGKLEFYSRLRHSVQFRVRPGIRFIRLTYRHGGLGGSPREGGQTTLAEAITDTQTGGVSVADASRLPNGGGTMLLNGTEYIDVSSVDTANDSVTINDRGIRRTSGVAHSSGDVIHYCPLSVREAIAAQTAVELATFENVVDRLIDTGDSIDLDTKIEQWQTEYEHVVSQHRRWHYA